MAEKSLKLTNFDRALLKYVPGIGSRRIASKAAANELIQSGAFEPTRKGDRPYTNFKTFGTSPDSRADSPDLAFMRQQSRFLVMNSILGGITERLTGHVIGNGLGFKAAVNADTLGLLPDEAKEKNKQLTDINNMFFFGQRCHYERTKTGGEIQGTLFKSMLEGGDSFAMPVPVKRKFFPFPFALQLFEAERANNRDRSSDNEFQQDGVLLNKNHVPVKITISNQYPDAIPTGTHTPIAWQDNNIFTPGEEIRQVFQVLNFIQDRPGAKRGIPYGIPAAGKIIDLKTLTENILSASGIQASFAGLLKGGKIGKMGGAPDGAKEDATDKQFAKINFKKGQILDVRGQDITLEMIESKQTGKDFTPFMEKIYGETGAILGMPLSIIMMLFGKSFSASRGEVALFWTTVLRFRYAFVYQFLAPFQEFLYTWAVSAGIVDLPGFDSDPIARAAWLGNPVQQWAGPRMVSIDPKKEADGYDAQVKGGFNSRTNIIRTSSENDPDEIFNELEAEKERGFDQVIADQTAGIMAENQEDEEDKDDDEE